MTAFVDRASEPGYELRVCVYAFHYLSVLEGLGMARQRGAEVRIIYDRRKDNLGKKYDEAVEKAGIGSHCTRCTSNVSAISHNKFIVPLKDGRPQAVLTGGTNFTQGGIFGYYNAVHVVEESEVTGAYLCYREVLSKDPKSAELRPILSEAYRIPEAKPFEGPEAIFSPRSGLNALQWYASLAAEAKEGLFATFAFGIHPFC